MRICAAIAAIAVLAFAAASQAAPLPKVTIKPVARTDKTVLGQPIVVPPNAELRAFTVEFEPGARLSVHKQPGITASTERIRRSSCS